MYKISKVIKPFGEIISIQIENSCIPADPSNTDYARFKKDINDETAQLQDADGNTMTAAEAQEYVATLP